MKMKKCLFLIMTIIYVFTFLCYESFATTPQAIGIGTSSKAKVPEISAPSAILVELETGQVLYRKNEEMPLHVSVACKLMNILVVIENTNLSDNVTVSADSTSTEGSALNLTVGSKYKLIDLLYAVMLTSANDAAMAIAEHVSSGDIEKFVAKMNETAEKLNMTNTHFTNPTGLYDERQYTTAKDISLLLKYALQNPTFYKIFTTKARPWYGMENEARILTSSNQLFWSYDGFEGGKTGYNKKEQQSIVSVATRSNLKLACVLLDVPESTMYSDTTALFDYGFNNYWKSTLVRKNEVLKTAVQDGNEIRLISQSDVMYVHPIGENFIKSFNVTAELKPPIRKTIPAGQATYILQDGTEIHITLYPETDIGPPEDVITRIRKSIQENRDIFILVLILLCIEALLLLYNLGRLARKFVLFVIKRKRSGKL